MSQVIYNCRVTNTDADVLRDWCVTPQNIHTGIDLISKQVYNFKTGTVIQVADAEDGKIVTVQCSVREGYRYCHLSSVDVSIGDYIPDGKLIGECKDWVHFECITSSPEKAILPIHIGHATYYRVDPKIKLKGGA